jgi:hypothetical protein
MAPPTDVSSPATRTRAKARPAYWTTFTGEMLALAGVLDIAYGIVALSSDRTVALGGAEGTRLDLAVWGWLPVAIGALLLLAGVGMLAGRVWALWLAIGLVVVSALAHVTLVHAYPLWALLMIMLNLVILDQLTTRWEDD